MSILRDLEPQNAKIHQNTSSGSATKLVWMLAALLLLGGIAWLAFYMQTGKNATANDTAAPFPPSSRENSTPKTARKELAAVAPEPARSEANPSTDVAVIREDIVAQASAKATKNDPPNVFQTMQMEMELEKSQNDKVAANATFGAQAKKTVVTEEAPKAQAGISASEGKKPVKAAATSSGNSTSRPTKTDKRYSERDIEIITAIVK